MSITLSPPKRNDLGNVRRSASEPMRNVDWILMLATFGIVAVGLVAIYSTSRPFLLYFFVLFRMWRIARLARDDFGLYICVGAMTMVAWHVFENIGMTMGIMPVTGIPLPLVSYGGSSTIAFLAMIGLVQNVHMRRMR